MEISLVNCFLYTQHVLPTGDNRHRGCPVPARTPVNPNSLGSDLCRASCRHGDLILLSISRSITILTVHSFSRCQFYFVLIISTSDAHDGLDQRQMVCVSFLGNPWKIETCLWAEKEKKTKDRQRDPETERLTGRDRKTHRERPQKDGGKDWSYSAKS